MTSSAPNQDDPTQSGQLALVKLLLEEHADSPWDDRRLSGLLAARGVQLGPRSVGRYRQRLDIPSSSQRRQWDPSTREGELKRIRSLVGLNGQGLVAPELAAAIPSDGPVEEPLDSLDATDPVLFSSDPPSPQVDAQAEMRRLLSDPGREETAEERTLSNIPLILRELLTPTLTPARGSRLEPSSAVPVPAPPIPDVEPELFDEAMLAAWQPYLEFRLDRPASTPQDLGLSTSDGWQELAPSGLGQEVDVGAELSEAGPILEKIFPGSGIESSVPEVRSSSEPGSYEVSLFLEGDTEPHHHADGQRAVPRARKPRQEKRRSERAHAEGVDVDTDILAGRRRGGRADSPARPRSADSTNRRGTDPVGVTPAELEDTRPERGAPRSRSSDSVARRRPFGNLKVPWSELWPFPKYRKLTEDVPALVKLNLRSSTSLLRPLLTSRLREAHKSYMEGQIPNAAEILEELVQARSSSIRFWSHLLLGEIRLIYDNDLADAREHLHRAMHMSGRAGRAQLLLAITLYLQDELEEAAEMLQGSKTTAPRSPTARLVLGLVLLELGELGRGVAEMEAARKKLDFTPELNERLRHAREILKTGI